jgi:hypothetical protein
MITFQEFLEKYKPKINHYLPNADEYDISFETYGEEFGYVLEQEQEYVWTSIDGENENSYIIPGKHLVNRSHYYVCKVPWSDETEEVNNNEMITVENAIDACLSFFKTLGYPLDRYNVNVYFKGVYDQETITVGDAKYTAMGYWEDLNNELTSEEEDLIHDFYANLI